MSKYEIANILRKTREDAGLKQQDVADYLKTTVQKVSSFETGRTRIDVDTLVMLCNLYKLDINYVTGNSIQPSSITPQNEVLLMSSYRKLSNEGQQRVIEYTDDLVSSGKYAEPEDPFAAVRLEVANIKVPKAE